LKQHKSYTVLQAIAHLERYCVYQERCHKEVEQKLKEMNMIPEAISHITAHLIQHNYLNETRFSKSFARGKFRIKKWGHNRIKQELKIRNISIYNINFALKEIEEKAYIATFNELAKKRLNELSLEKNIQKKKKKLADFLLYRGWEANLIWDFINNHF